MFGGLAVILILHKVQDSEESPRYFTHTERFSQYDKYR